MNSTVLTSAGISPEDCQALSAAIDRLTMLRTRPRHMQPHVVCTGIYNAGKSTLLNALTGTNHFPTGDIPTTKEVARLTQDGFTYVDTPGLNAQGADDAVTAKALKEADVILFASAAQNGGLSQAEAQWLEGLKKDFGARFPQRLIFVMTKCGQMEDVGVEKVAAKFGEDFQKALGFTPEKTFRTDAAVWAEGRAQNESLLVEAGGIDPLREYILQRCQPIQRSLERDAQADRKAAADKAAEMIARLKGQCREGMARLSRQALADDEMERLFAETEKVIKEKTNLRVYIRHHFDTGNNWSSSDFEFENSSEYTAMKSVKRNLKALASGTKYWGLSHLNGEIDKVIETYGETGVDSIYFKRLDAVNRALEELYSSLSQYGIVLTKQQEINVQVNVSHLSSGLSWRREVEFLSDSDYVSAYESRISTRDNSYTTYTTGWFGMTREEIHHKYEVDGYGAYLNIQSDIVEKIERRLQSVEKYIEENYLNPFCRKVRDLADRRLAAMREEAKKYLASQKETAHKPYQAACDYF